MSQERDERRTPAPASMFAVELLGELVRRGIRDIVVCPGSRSQALALAAAAAERAGAIRLHVRIDERVAGFLALGIARETGMPAPVIVTSGTAVANLAPAVYEAHESRVPMLLLTADRPAELHGIRANQTTRQAGMFSGIARESISVAAPGGGVPNDDAAAETPEAAAESPDAARLAPRALAAALGLGLGAAPGPVQLNLAFREPLSGTAGFDEMIARGFVEAAMEADGLRERGELPTVEARAAAGRAPVPSAGQEFVLRGDRLGVVIAGAGAGSQAEEFAHAAGLPLLAEVVSGARYGRETISAYATLITEPGPEGVLLGDLVEFAVVYGHPTLTRELRALLIRDDIDVVVVDTEAAQADPPGSVDAYDPSRRARIVARARVADDYDAYALRGWLGAWVTADRELLRQRTTVHEPDLEAARATGYRERNAYARAELRVKREPVTRELLVESVWRASWPHDRLVLAASRLVRVLDGLAPARKLRVHANRGLAGIDGTIATALGVAVASQGADEPALAAGTTRVLIGDLALLHDSGALLLQAAEPRPRIQVFVGNDGGGTIFSGLEVARTADPDAATRVLTTPQHVDIEALARAYGWEYRRVTTRGELEDLLTEPVAGPMIVEAPLSEDEASR